MVLVEDIPRHYAGRTGSILARARAFASRGRATEVVILGWSAELDQVRAEIRARGHWAEGLQIRALYECADTGADDRGGARRTTTDPPDCRRVDVADGYQLLVDGLVVQQVVTAADGTPLVRRTPLPEGELVQDLDRDGGLRRECVFLPGDPRPRRETFYRDNGARCFERVRTPLPDDPRRFEDRATVFDADDQELGEVAWLDYVHQLLDRLAGSDRILLSVEARVCDPYALTWDRPDVHQAYVAHNPHILPPYTDPNRIRGGFKALFRARNRVAVVFLTRAQRADAEARFGPCDNFFVIPHAVRPPADGSEVVRDPNLVVVLARLVPQKQLDAAVEAFATVVAQVPTARLEIYGEGPLRPDLQAQIDQLGLGASVRLAGFTADPDHILAGAAVSLLCSEYEALGLTLVESLLNRCPAVSFNIRYGPADVIRNGENGLLVPAGDRAGLADSIIRLLRDGELREQLGANGPAIAEDFTEDVLVDRWATLYRRLVG